MSNPELLQDYKTALAAGETKQVRRIEDKLIRENMSLVKKLVSKLMRRMTTQWNGEESDLMQAGCIGMLTAWKRWDPDKGRFSTYAMHWIRHEVQDALGDDQPIYKPRQSGKPWSVYKQQEAILARTGREATAEELGITQAKYEEWRASPVVRSLDDEGIYGNEVVRRSGRSALARNRGSGAGEGDNSRTGIHEIVADPKPNPEAAVSSSELHELLLAGMQELTDRESYVIAQLFIEGAPYNFLAQQLGVCDSSVWTIRDSALKKLREAMAASV